MKKIIIILACIPAIGNLLAEENLNIFSMFTTHATHFIKNWGTPIITGCLMGYCWHLNNKIIDQKEDIQQLTTAILTLNNQSTSLQLKNARIGKLLKKQRLGIIDAHATIANQNLKIQNLEANAKKNFKQQIITNGLIFDLIKKQRKTSSKLESLENGFKLSNELHSSLFAQVQNDLQIAQQEQIKSYNQLIHIIQK